MLGRREYEMHVVTNIQVAPHDFLGTSFYVRWCELLIFFLLWGGTRVLIGEYWVSWRL